MLDIKLNSSEDLSKISENVHNNAKFIGSIVTENNWGIGCLLRDNYLPRKIDINYDVLSKIPALDVFAVEIKQKSYQKK